VSFFAVLSLLDAFGFGVVDLAGSAGLDGLRRLRLVVAASVRLRETRRPGPREDASSRAEN